VSHDTKLLIIENNRPKVIEIGAWIDGYLDASVHKSKVVLSGPEDANMELIDISKVGVEAYVASTDDNGRMDWHKITNVTRHDPSEYIYNIKTKWGREVSVVASKSLLIWNDETRTFEERDSEDVKLGDMVPTTFNMPMYKETISEVDLRDYLPAGKYMYGTDYNSGLLKCPVKKFKVLDDHVYLRCAKYNSTPLKETFELNRENGFFIGIYLAEGNTCKDYVGIANNDPEIQKAVRDWFEKQNITHTTQVKPFDPKRPGLSTSIRGYSSILVQFLESFLGKYSSGKYVPNEAFLAPDEFIKGLIDGYISGDGCVTDYHVVVTSVSKVMIEGMSALLARYGIFTKLSKCQQKKNNIGSKNILMRYELHVQSKYVYRFGEVFTLTHAKKQEKLDGLCARTTLDNMSFLYEEHNNVMKDKIISIEKVLSSSDEKYKKVYDITVPETLNFQVFNGMNCRDTSSTGYIQRRLIKAMEDAKIYYDQTVRNAAGSVVQFIYGEDGMEGTKIEKQLVPTIDKNVFDIDADYHLRTRDPLDIHLTSEAMDAMRTEGAWAARATAHFEKLLEDRAYLIEKVFRGEKNNKVYYPIPFERIIKTAHERAKAVGIADLPTDLTPTVILDGIDGIIKDLLIQPGQGTFYLELLTRVYLSPKPLLFKYHMKKDTFTWVLSEVRRYFAEAIAAPGEMVGIIAAQSVGEPLSQLTLDSFHVSGTAAAVKATSGVPRINELLSVSKNIKKPSHLIYLKPDVGTVTNPTETDEEGVHADPRVREAKERAMQVLRSLETTRLEDIIASTEIFFDPMADDAFDTTLTEDQRFLDIYRAFEDICPSADGPTTPWVLRMTIDRAKLHAARLTMTELYLRIIAGNPHIRCLFSDDNASELVMRIKLIQENDKPIEDHVAALKALEQTLTHKPTKGVERIRKVSMHVKNSENYNAATQAFEKRSEWVLDTDGSNFAEILANPNVDATRTITNDPREINAVLGIEAARNSLHFEIMDVIRESSVNYRHLSLLIDTMTHRGTLMPIDRHGINRGDVGPLAKSSFEETTDMLINASVFSDYDRVNGVSSTIMLGQLPPCGTGDCEILLDEDAYMGMLRNVRHQLKTIKETEGEDREDHASDEEEHEHSTDPCAISALEFKYKPAYKQPIGNAFGVPEVGF